MIPKVIHYCWFGGKALDALGEKCLKSWKKYFPEYEIIRWDESNVDLNSCQYVKDAYNEKKWAFVSDYVRFKILYEQGGIYFDTDVEVIRSFEKILNDGPFMGCEYRSDEDGIRVAPGLGIAAEPGMSLYKEIIEEYQNSSFYKNDGSLNLYDVVQRTSDILKRHGLRNENCVQEIENIKIYPHEYFCPINTNNERINITDKTYSIHHYAASWTTKKQKRNKKLFAYLCRLFGENTAIKIRGYIKQKLG